MVCGLVRSDFYFFLILVHVGMLPEVQNNWFNLRNMQMYRCSKQTPCAMYPQLEMQKFGSEFEMYLSSVYHCHEIVSSYLISLWLRGSFWFTSQYFWSSHCTLELSGRTGRITWVLVLVQVLKLFHENCCLAVSRAIYFLQFKKKKKVEIAFLSFLLRYFDIWFHVLRDLL